jgi:hypothetical protein
MLKADVLHVIERMSPTDITKLVLVLKSGQGVNVETVFRYEETYMIVRGRENGSNDENRAFFVAYEEVSYARLERIVMLHELEKMYGTTTPVNSAVPLTTTPPPVAITTPPPAQPLDPATIARNNLLERIRAARSTVGHATSARQPK